MFQSFIHSQTLQFFYPLKTVNFKQNDEDEIIEFTQNDFPSLCPIKTKTISRKKIAEKKLIQGKLIHYHFRMTKMNF